MSLKNVEEMIYIRGERIYFTPIGKEYDITDHIQELVQEIEKLKKR